MTKKFSRLFSALSLAALLISSGLLSSTASALSADNDALPTNAYAFAPVSAQSVISTNKTKAPINQGTPRNYENTRLYVGGMPFGVKFMTKGVLVVGIGNGKNELGSSGIRCNDVIVSVNGKEIYSAEELNAIVQSCGGKPLSVVYKRDGKEYSVRLTPTYSSSDGKYNLGLYVRDSGAGIGTVTFIVPKTLEFGGLGHGICEANSGKLIPMERGSVVDVKINGIVKGLCGSPGEVKGYFNSSKIGTLLENTDCGVYGVFASQPKEIIGEPVSLGLRDTVKEGKAYLCTMLDGNKVEKYAIEISDIDRQATGNKCFTVKVTDKALIAKTGGIIQGMSGSPIVQNGKLVGAVTHVLINDPTTGYGIFIENMLNAANIPMAKAS